MKTPLDKIAVAASGRAHRGMMGELAATMMLAAVASGSRVRYEAPYGWKHPPARLPEPQHLQSQRIAAAQAKRERKAAKRKASK